MLFHKNFTRFAYIKVFQNRCRVRNKRLIFTLELKNSNLSLAEKPNFTQIKNTIKKNLIGSANIPMLDI